ncbi:hypothetical protein SRB5_24900 [Streptomyces sp. RB5]|uniref:CU044_5270 family protein n=1 Tax=Streptomyces smaragdinus TaxID=2585196 RepID=A0A7K0CFW4_9ACTN|nr:CU044_5270 family protein [Streptomyces smaragdinus]MQY12357.1 hypothetical protein [Streptomyces smaragdinus]
MDELTLVRELRTEAPDPTPAKLAAGRRALTAVTARRPRRAVDRRITVPAVVAAVTAVAVAVSLLVSGTPRTAEAPLRAAPRLTPAELLHRAAAAAERQTVAEPRADQWIYTLRTERNRTLGTATARDEQWRAYPGTDEIPGLGDSYSARDRWAFDATLPDDPRAVLSRVRAFLGPDNMPGTGDDPAAGQTPEETDVHSYRAVTYLICSRLPDPAGQAKLLRALAAVPGLTVTDRPVRDAAGRPAVALGRDDPGTEGGRLEMLLDPGTYRLLGVRTVATEPLRIRDGRTLGTGAVLMETAFLRTAVVDADHERP